MSLARSPFGQIDSPSGSLPTMYDLPSEVVGEPGLPDEFHLWQAQLCRATFRPSHFPPDQVFTASDLNLYYDSNHTGWYKRPDWFAVVGVPRLYQRCDLRLSYVIWQEQVSPTVAIEFLSPSTKHEDLGLRESSGPQPSKWTVYEKILAIPYYVVFDGSTNLMRVFHLEGDRYQELSLSEPRFWIASLDIGLGLWHGQFPIPDGPQRYWLRWFNSQNNWIPTDAELAQQERDLERQQKELAQQRAEQLAERLRQLGVDPEEV